MDFLPRNLLVLFLCGSVFLSFCVATKVIQSHPMNLRVQVLSARSLQITWDPPVLKESESLVGYSLVFVPVHLHQKKRTHVELFMNHQQHVLTNLHPGTRYKIKLAPLMNDGKLKGVYTNWVNARTPADNKTSDAPNPHPKAGSQSSSLVPRHCKRIGRHCENIGYNFTQMPNIFNQQTQDEAERELSQFISVIKANCSLVLKVFLCSLYLPPCSDDASQATPPCRSVCWAARRECEPWIKKSGYEWPYKFDCASFPEPSDQACVGEDGAITHVQKTKMPSQCEPLEVDMCKTFSYTSVKMPNSFHDDTQNESRLEIEKFLPLVKWKCSPALHFFLCSLYLPPCVINMDGLRLPPCKEVCEQARAGCEPVLILMGYTWPAKMDCSHFPAFDRSGLSFCLQPYSATTAEPKSHSLQPTQPQPRCEALKIPICRNVNYTHTAFPNYLNHSSQYEVRRALREFKPQLKSACSQQLKRFLCFLLVPYCAPGVSPLKPCRSLCEKVKSSCGHVSVRWYNELDCSRFPTLSQDHLCFGETPTSMDCIGPQSKPCTVFSSTFPIILKCSSPGIRFTVDEISVFLNNGTRVSVDSTADALLQCNQSRWQSEGIYECRFVIDFGDVGIDVVLVRSVAVNYHCLKE